MILTPENGFSHIYRHQSVLLHY